MGIIKTIAKKVIQIAGVVRVSTPSGSKNVDIDIQIKTGEYFEIGRKGLRIDAPDYVPADSSDDANAEGPLVSAAYKSEGHGISLMSEAARNSSSGHKGPLVFSILPDLERQERAATPRTPVGANNRQDLAERGHPSDDQTLVSLKASRLLYAFRLTVALKAFYKCKGSTKSAGDAESDAFKVAGLTVSIEESIKKGRALERQSEADCQPNLQRRAERKICAHWLANRDSTSLLNRAAELVDTLRLINRAIIAYERLAQGKRHTKQTLREGKTPSDAWVSTEMYGTPKQQENVNLTFVEKMKLALYTGVNPSHVWPDTINLGDGAPEVELFHGATLVAALGAGRQIKATTAELRPLAKALLRLPHMLEAETDGVKAKSRALIDVYVMLGSIAEMTVLQEMLSAIVERHGVITITPMNAEPLLPLSSLRTKNGEFIIPRIPNDPVDDPSSQQSDDIYWARKFWRSAPAQRKCN